MPTRGFKLSLKQLSDQGEFEGIASVYGLQDLGNDVVEPGAFSKTLASGGKERPLLWRHDAPIGTCELTDSPSALLLKGKLTMGVQAGREAYELLKSGAVQGISIGYQSVSEKYVGDARHLTEIRLWECSLVPLPMCEGALVTGVKSFDQTKIRAVLASFRKDVLAALK